MEGYLNTQRFYIPVEPDSFEIAMGTYDRLRKEKKVSGVGPINTCRLDQYETVLRGICGYDGIISESICEKIYKHDPMQGSYVRPLQPDEII